MQYEVSSFAKARYRALHNQNYWRDVKYLGIGPSAHSYNGHFRSQNVAHNTEYIHYLQKGKLPLAAKERLSKEMRWQELLLTSLRTRAGLHLRLARRCLARGHFSLFSEEVDRLCQAGLLENKKGHLRPTSLGLKLADEMALRLLQKSKLVSEK